MEHAHYLILDSYMDIIYAKSIADIRGQVIREECNGCQVSVRVMLMFQ